MKRTLKMYPKTIEGKRISAPDVRPLQQREKPLDTRRGMVCKVSRGIDAVQTQIEL